MQIKCQNALNQQPMTIIYQLQDEEKKHKKPFAIILCYDKVKLT